MKIRNALIWTSALLLLSGCTQGLKQPSPKIEYYTLEYRSPDIEVPGMPPVVLIDLFSVEPIFNTEQIIYRENQYGRGNYFYHRWRANPAELVTYSLIRDFKHNQLFAGVLGPQSSTGATHLVEGSVDQFLEWNEDGSCRAVLGLSITLLREKEPDVTKRILFQESYQTMEPCQMNDPRSLAESMSLAMSRLSGRIQRDIYDVLAARY